MVDFEYDAVKSRANKDKHGIDFEEAQMLWRDTGRLELDIPNRSEPRRIMIARLNGKHWTVVMTDRNDNIRLISVRRSRQNERKAYEEKNDIG